jgi:hypothetical protein
VEVGALEGRGGAAWLHGTKVVGRREDHALAVATRWPGHGGRHGRRGFGARVGLLILGEAASF